MAELSTMISGIALRAPSAFTTCRRMRADLVIALGALVLFHVVSMASGRLDENRGFGWDGESYARMVTDSLDQGSPDTRTRPLLLLVTRIPYALGLDVYSSFWLLNYLYAFALYLLVSLQLARADLRWSDRAVVVANLALCIATSKMFGFYPVLVDLGALALTMLAFSLSTANRHRLAAAACVLAAASREFGVAAALYGMHRAVRQGRGWSTAALYLPSLLTIAAIRWQVTTAMAKAGAPRLPLSITDAIANLSFWYSPAFVAGFVYFAVVVFGGISALLVLRSRWCLGRVRAEPELATFLVIVVAASAAGSADVWRYLMFALPAAIVLFGRYLSECDGAARSRVLIAVTAVTILTQRPLEMMDRVKYFLDWFPLYYVLRLREPVDGFEAIWAGRLLVLALTLIALHYATRRRRGAATGSGEGDRSLEIRTWPGLARALPAILLLIVAIWSVREPVAAPSPSPIGTAARIRVNWELENRRLLHGELPLWNPEQFGGQAHLADPETLALYPPHLLLRPLPIDLFFPLSFVLHAWLAGLGGYLVARQLGVQRAASLAAGFAVMLAGVMAPVVDPYSAGTERMAWMPLALALAMRSTARRSFMPHPALILIVGIALLSGSLRGALYVLGIVTGWYLFAAIQERPTVSRATLLRQFASLVVLGAGIGGVVLVPYAALAASARPVGGLTYDEPGELSWHSKGLRTAQPDPTLAAALRPLRGHRTLSACQEVVDSGQLSALGVPAVGGYGGVLLGDYAWFANLAARSYPERNRARTYAGLADAGRTTSRGDLIRFLDVEYLVACAPPDESWWERAGEMAGATVYRNRDPLGRAVWTCAPEPIGREEIEYRLIQLRYDATLTLRKQVPLIAIRWVAGLADGDRARAEAAFQLSPDRFLGDRTWRYEMRDSSVENAESIVTSPMVEDTAGLDRANFALLDREPGFDEPKNEWLIGHSDCPDTTAATVLDKDNADGRVVAEVTAPRDGIVLFSEAFNPQRLAWVDGHAVTPLKVNLAFTGVPVSSGTHRVEIAYTRRSLALGFGVSVLALGAWFLGERRSRWARPGGRS